MKILVLLLLVVFSTSEGMNLAELQEKLTSQYTSPLVSLLFVYDGATEMGPMIQQAIEVISEKKKGYFKVIPIDCNTDDSAVLKQFPYCGDEIRPKLPLLFFTEPLLNPVDPSQGTAPEPKNHVFEGNLQEKALYEFAIPLMKLYSTNLKKMSDWKKFQETYPDVPNVIYFTDKGKISPFYKALTANFRNTIVFAHVFKNSTLCEEFGVTEFPTLLLNGKKKVEMTSNLLEQIEILKEHEGPESRIIIEEFKQSTLALDEDSLQEKIYENPRHILVHIPGVDGKEHAQWKKTQESFKKMFDYFESDTLATKFGVKHRPAIVYFPKSLAKKDLKKAVFYPSDNFRIIYDEVSSLIEDFTVPVSSDMEMQQLTSIHLKEGRLIAALFHKEDISLSYRVLSNDERFKDEIAFVRMKDPAPEVLTKFQVKKLPSLFIMTVDKEDDKTQPEAKKKKPKKDDQPEEFKLQLAQYTGRFNYDELSTYLNYFVAKPEQTSTSSQRSIGQFNSKKRFEKNCIGESCYLLLIDGTQEKKESKEEYINILKSSMSDVVQNVGYIDAKCHSQVLSSLEIYAEDLPALIYLNSKFEKYSRLIGRIEEKSIETFKAKVKVNKGIFRNYEKISFENKDCLKEHQKLKKLESSGYEMSAQEAAILEQVRKEEEEKKAQAGLNDKSSRKRRKKRRPKEEDSEL